MKMEFKNVEKNAGDPPAAGGGWKEMGGLEQGLPEGKREETLVSPRH